MQFVVPATVSLKQTYNVINYEKKYVEYAYDSENMLLMYEKLNLLKLMKKILR